MDKIEREKIHKQLKKYERLGATRFQKVVFAVERLKFKVLKKLCPNFLMHYDKFCDFKKRRLLKRTKTEEERKQIIEDIKFAKMAMRKEFHQEKNRNYHIDKKRPTEIYPYLEWNKEVHKTGLIKNGVVIPFLIVGTVMSIPGALPLLVFEVLSAGINFECVNIQNYSMARYKLVEERLRRQEEMRQQKAIEEFGAASEVIGESIQKKEELPSMDEIIDRIENREQLEQLRRLILKERQDRSLENDRGKQICA